MPPPPRPGTGRGPGAEEALRGGESALARSRSSTPGSSPWAALTEENLVLQQKLKDAETRWERHAAAHGKARSGTAGVTGAVVQTVSMPEVWNTHRRQAYRRCDRRRGVCGPAGLAHSASEHAETIENLKTQNAKAVVAYELEIKKLRAQLTEAQQQAHTTAPAQDETPPEPDHVRTALEHRMLRMHATQTLQQCVRKWIKRALRKKREEARKATEAATKKNEIVAVQISEEQKDLRQKLMAAMRTQSEQLRQATDTIQTAKSRLKICRRSEAHKAGDATIAFDFCSMSRQQIV